MARDIDPFKVSSPRIFLVRMLVFLILISLIVFVIHQQILVERPTQRAIVLGKGGQTLKWIGQASREELCDILDRKVHLFLHVKVKENWAEERGLFSDMGLDFDV